MKSFIQKMMIVNGVKPLVNLSQSDLILQIITLAVLLISMTFKRKSRFAIHGITMLVAVVLNAFSFFLIMWPSFSGFDPFGFRYRISIVTLMHGVLGAVAEIFGVFLIVNWALRRSTKYCVRNKMLMRVTLIVWLIALILGILLYAVLFEIIAI